MKIYDLELSGHAHRARLFANLLGLEYNLIPVDLLNGAHKQPEYLAKNPFGQVPALEDGDVTVYDSNAILVYLASKYDSDRTWLPVSPELAAQVQVWLSKAANELHHGPATARLITVFGAGYDPDVTIQKANALLNIMNEHLQNRTWFVGNNPTIADIALYSYTAHAPEGGVNLAHYPNIVNWLQKVEGLPGFIAMPTTETDAKKALAA
ncbi:glutathione S-transferase family protein [Planctobacterium marinum]|uniref:Glutathione S-transferase n=1 Tax=Planctobacterium marinum TaxID=1631968 RepID=A0AA48HL44_9ALTE|nr:glutathione S-transferase [Planctobacterium marinum]